MDAGRWPRKVKAATVEGQQGRGRPGYGWLDEVKTALAVRKEGLQGGNTTRERGVCGENLRGRDCTDAV